MLQGWCTYFKHGVSKATFGYLDEYAWRRVVRWLRRRFLLGGAASARQAWGMAAQQTGARRRASGRAGGVGRVTPEARQYLLRGRLLDRRQRERVVALLAADTGAESLVGRFHLVLAENALGYKRHATPSGSRITDRQC